MCTIKLRLAIFFFTKQRGSNDHADRNASIIYLARVFHVRLQRQSLGQTGLCLVIINFPVYVISTS